MSRRGTAPAKLARLFSKKIPDRFARHGRMHEDARRQDFLAASQKRCGTAFFHNGLCTGRGRFQENAACQADASGCARGSGWSFKKIQPLVAGLQEDGASRSGAADPVQARAITKSDGCWRTRARGRESARALQRPAEDRRAWQLSGPGLHAQARPGRSAGLLAGSVGGYGRLGEQARSARSSCIQRDPGPCYTGMQGDAAAGKYGCPQAVCK